MNERKSTGSRSGGKKDTLIIGHNHEIICIPIPHSSTYLAAATAEKLGVSERKVYRLLAVGTALDPKDIRLLRAAPQPVQMSDLQHIAKIGEPAERYFVCEALGTGRAKKAAEARKAYRQGDMDAPAADPVEEGFQGLMKAWTRAPMAARRRFLDHMSGDIEQMGWDRDE